jgi:hypothetical protein
VTDNDVDVEGPGVSARDDREDILEVRQTGVDEIRLEGLLDARGDLRCFGFIYFEMARGREVH